MKAEKVVEVESKIKNRPDEKAETVSAPEVVFELTAPKKDGTPSEEKCADLISGAGLADELIQLRSVEKEVAEECHKIKTKYFLIGQKLKTVKDLEVYSYLGYMDFYDYAEAIFGFKKSFVSNLINISEKFELDQIENTSVSVLCELLPIAEDKKAVNLLKKFTVKDVRKIKKIYTAEGTLNQLLVLKGLEFADALEIELKKISKIGFSRGNVSFTNYFGYSIQIPFNLVYENPLNDGACYSFNLLARTSLMFDDKIKYSCDLDRDLTKDFKKLCEKIGRSYYDCYINTCLKGDSKSIIKEVTDAIENLQASVEKYRGELEKQQKAKLELAETLAKETGKTPEEILKEEEEAKKQLTKKPKSPHGLTNNEKRTQFVRDWNNWTKCEFKSDDVPFEVYRFNVSEVGEYFRFKTPISDYAVCYYHFEEKHLYNSSAADIAAKLAEINY